MAQQNNPPSDATDPLWESFDAVEKDKAAEREAAYREIEGYNGTILNQVAGVEDVHLTLVKKLSEETEADGPTPADLVLSSKSQLLYLRPDTREALFESGESPDTAGIDGDPHMIIGDVPERTQKLIKNLQESLSATHDTDSSSVSDEIWRGDVAGQPIKLVLTHGIMTSSTPTKTVEKPTLNARIYRDDFPVQSDIDKAASDAAKKITDI